MLGNITRTELPHQRAFEYLYYGSGHLQQTQWRDNEQLTVLAEYQRDRLHRETLRTSGALDNETGYDCRGRITHQVARQMNASQFVTPVIDRRYRWDKRNQLIERSVSYGQTGEVFTAGHWYYHSYQYDPLGQLTAHLGSVQTEHFLYDAAANLLTRPHTEAPHNQVPHSDRFDYRYDGFGRMVSRYEKGSSSGQRYHYDSDHRIIEVDIDQGPLGYQRGEYRYDILGRRIEKRLWKASAIANTVTYHQHEPDEVYTFGWVGMRLVSEHSSAAPHTTVYHAYNDQSYTPLARIECTDNPLNPQRAIYYTHSSLSGLPEALTNSEGEIVWQGQYSAWGHLQRQTRPTSTFNREQNLRFQGQYFDKETGLHYNTFRYYAPDLGRFTQQDPIGLAGGINLYAYAPNPLTWVDPWGWAEFDVDSYENLRAAVKGGNTGLDAHHSGQKAIMADLVSGYDPKTAPAILVSKSGHTVSKEGVGIVSRSKINSSTGLPFKNARELLARDIRELRRVYSDIPNSALKELIAKNKEMYPEMRKTNNTTIKGC
ncbi:RHS repeat-associated core domain-containing protein [Proteus mirabilis]|uniref:RHS repeat-associated core domain-containing protein n=1 Tax=Proteus mirabilis TaxID=584 RepID=UPI0021D7A3AA|nr:RHS repeat-associated core domain-containing protein [Proteus mirabilis]MCU9588894.1 RHS domain-containing protein [Proteus mirabilis]